MRGNVLIIDDNPNNLHLLEKLLVDNEYEVRITTSAKLAFKSIEIKKPELILLDIMMPEMDGYEVCQKLKSNCETLKIPIIFLSVKDEAIDKIKAFEVGGVDYITKPFNEKEVLVRVKTHLENYRMKEHLEEEVKKRTYELIQQSKMAAMGEMIGMITHQWRQPLNVISLNIEYIKLNLKNNKIDENILKGADDNILKQIYYMNNTIDDFRNFFQPSQNLVNFKACELARDVYKLIEAKMKDLNVEFIVHEHKCFEILGLPNEFKQVILNIYNNACDVFDEKNIKNRKIELFFETKDKMAIIYIRDTGGGIPTTLLPNKLFEPYVTTKGDKGTGIGLYICKKIIEEKFNGKIWVHNINNGAEFIIELPLNS